MWAGSLEKIDNFRWKIPQTYKNGMRVPGIIFASDTLIEQIKRDQAPEQVANVAMLPGIVRASYAMPDIHWGYGFPIGGVAAFDYENGIISPGGVGYDINCGVSMLKTNLFLKDIKLNIKDLVNTIFREVPSGVGSEGKLKLTRSQLDDILHSGAQWAIENGYGWKKDSEYTEGTGRLNDTDTSKVSEKAKERGYSQIGTLGSGNHFAEIQAVDRIFMPDIARRMGIENEGQITVMVHTGSRGLGHQVATDYIKIMEQAAHKYNIALPDKQLACAPIGSSEAASYYKAMNSAANFGFANRQMIIHWIRGSFSRVLNSSSEELGMDLIYGVAHNIAKVEEYVIDGKRTKVVVHRKGATRSFNKNNVELPDKYRDIGQPVLIPGDMGRASYLLVGTDKAMSETFGSTCHGAGRALSRSESLRRFSGESVKKELYDRGIYVKSATSNGAAEEAPESYKNVDDVVHAVAGAGISNIVARMVPIGVIKG